MAKIEAKRQFEAVNIGDIFCMGWGYEAHLYNFYQVVGKKGGKCSLRLLKVKRDFADTNCGWASNGWVTPIKDSFQNDEIINKKINECVAFYLQGYGSASRWDGRPREEANWH